MLISITLAIVAVAVGLINTAIWMQLAKKATDSITQTKFMYFALTTLLLASGEVVFVLRKSRGLTGGTFEYLQYSFMICGFVAFMLCARLHLKGSEVYGGFSTAPFGRVKARSAERTAGEAASKKKPKGKKSIAAWGKQKQF